MSAKQQVFANLKRAPTALHLPGCPNGCGEMLAIDDGWYCPICNRFRNYPRGMA